MIGKCPKCEQPVARVNTSSVELHGADKTLKGVAYLCQSCNSVLSVSIDPLARWDTDNRQSTA